MVRHARSLCLRSADLKLVSLFKSLPRKGRETCTLSFSLWGAMEGVAHSPRSPLGLVLSDVFSVDLVHLCPSVVGGSHDPSSCQLKSPPCPFPGRTQLLLRATWLTHSSFPNVSIRARCKVPGVLGSRCLPMSPQRGNPTAGTLPGLLQGHQHLAFSWHSSAASPASSWGAQCQDLLLAVPLAAALSGGLPSLGSEDEERRHH